MEIDDTYNKVWLQTEYNQAHSNAIAARRWNDFQKTSDLYPNLIYVAVMDERTRDEHRLLNGTIRPINDSFWDTYYPPIDWNCRCTARQTDEDPTSVPADLPGVAEGFDNNCGKDAKIFSDNLPYMKDNSDMSHELLKFVGSQIKNIPEIRESFNAFNNPEAGFISTFFDGNTGGMVKTSETIAETDLAANRGIAEASARNGSLVYLLPINETGTSIDTLTDGILNEYKSCSNTTSSIDNLLRDANRQAKGMSSKIDVTIELSDLKNIKDVKKAIISRWNRSGNLDRLYVKINNEIYGPYSRDDIMSYRFL